MRKLLLSLIIPFFSFTLSAHELDTIIIKNNYEYRFEMNKQGNGVTVKNETTYQEHLKLAEKYKPKESEWKEEVSKITKRMKTENINFRDSFLEIFKETFKGCNLQNFNFKSLIFFNSSVKSSGHILNLSIVLDKDFIEYVGYDKIIELETNFRNKYKLYPFDNQNIKWIKLMVIIDKNKLNEAFK